VRVAGCGLRLVYFNCGPLIIYNPHKFIITMTHTHTHTHSYSVLSVPFYDTRQQQYIKILCVSARPAGPLAARVKTVRPPQLSTHSRSNGGANGASIHALTFADATFMTPDDLPDLFAFLANNGYTVETGLTKLVARYACANSLVCLISYAAPA